MSYKRFILQKTCSVMKCIVHWRVTDLNQDLRVWWDCTAPFWTLCTSKQGFFSGSLVDLGARGVCMWYTDWKSSYLNDLICAFRADRHWDTCLFPPPAPPAAFLSSASANFSFPFTLFSFVSSLFFFSVTKSPAHQAAKTAAGPERLPQSGQLHLSWINDLSRCFANSSECVIVTVIICENAAWRLQFIYPWNIESLQ